MTAAALLLALLAAPAGAAPLDEAAVEALRAKAMTLSTTTAFGGTPASPPHNGSGLFGSMRAVAFC